MRNAVIRKKLLKEQAIIRKFMHYPQRIIAPVIDIDWTDANQQRLNTFMIETTFTH